MVKSFFSFYNRESLILKDGLKEFYNLVVWYIPIVLAVILYAVSYFVKTDLDNYTKNLISILPSLIGFLIASATILITITSESIDKIHEDTNSTYRQIGGAIFFYATKISIILLVFSFISSDKMADILNCYIYNLFTIILILYFSKLIVSISYGLMFLTSAIETIPKKEDEEQK